MPIVEVNINNFQPASMEETEVKLAHLVSLGESIMATLQEVKDAVAAEAAEVQARINNLEVQIQELKDGMTAGDGVVTAADLDELLMAVQGIFTPAPPEVEIPVA